MTVRRAGAILALAYMCTATPAAQVTPPALKAAFVFNFAKFTDWPADALAPGADLLICVVNDRGVGQNLQELTKGRAIGGHNVVVSNLRIEPASFDACRILYASGIDVVRAVLLIDSLKRAPVLTISDLDRFAALGGVAEFFVERGTMKFAINQQAAQRARLRLSSRLLSLARIVKDERDGLQR